MFPRYQQIEQIFENPKENICRYEIKGALLLYINSFIFNVNISKICTLKLLAASEDDSCGYLKSLLTSCVFNILDSPQ